MILRRQILTSKAKTFNTADIHKSSDANPVLISLTLLRKRPYVTRYIKSNLTHLLVLFPYLRLNYSKFKFSLRLFTD